MQRSIASLALTGLGVASATLYAQTTVSVDSVTIRECEGVDTCPMVFTAKWHIPNSLDVSLLGAPTMQWKTRGRLEENISESQASDWASAFNNGNGDFMMAGQKNAVGTNTFSFNQATVSSPTGREAKFTVMVMNDNVQEFAKEKFEIIVAPSFDSTVPVWFDINVQTCAGCVARTPAVAAMGYIEDDESATLSISDRASPEQLQYTTSATQYFEFDVTLSHKMDIPIFVNYKTNTRNDVNIGVAKAAACSASPCPASERQGFDFSGVSENDMKGIEFPANQDGKQRISIEMWDDDLQENLETFQVELTYPGVKAGGVKPAERKLTLARNLAVGTFTEEREGATITMEDLVQEEGDSKFVFTAKLNKPVDTSVRLEIGTADGNQLYGTPATSNPAVYERRVTENLEAFPRQQQQFLYTVNVVNDNIQSKHTQKGDVRCVNPEACTQKEVDAKQWGRRNFLVNYKIDEMVWAGNQGKSFWNVGDAKNQVGQARGFIYDNEKATISIGNVGMKEETDNFQFSVVVSHATTDKIPIKFRVANYNEMPALKNSMGETIKSTNVAVFCEDGQACPAGWDLAVPSGAGNAVTPAAPGQDPAGQKISLNTDKTPLILQLYSNNDIIAEPTEIFGLKIMEDPDVAMATHWSAEITQSVGAGTLRDNDALYWHFGKDPVTGVEIPQYLPDYRKEYCRRQPGDPVDAKNPCHAILGDGVIDDANAKIKRDSTFEFNVYLSHQVSEDFTLQFYTFQDAPTSTFGNSRVATEGDDYVKLDTTHTFKKDQLVTAGAKFTVEILEDNFIEMDEYFGFVVTHKKTGPTATFSNGDFLINNAKTQDISNFVYIVDDDVPDIILCPSADSRCGGTEYMFDESSDRFRYTATLSHSLSPGDSLVVPWYAEAGSQGTTKRITVGGKEMTGYAADAVLDFPGSSSFEPQFTFWATGNAAIPPTGHPGSQGVVTNPSAGITIRVVDDNVQEGKAASEFEYFNIAFKRDLAKPSKFIKEANHLSSKKLASESFAINSWVFEAFITDNEFATVSVPDVAQAEGSNGFVFTATLSHRVTRDMSVSWKTKDGSAKAGTDYVAVAGLNMNLPRDSVNPQTFTVQVTNDQVDEGDETFQVELSSVDMADHGVTFSAGTLISGSSTKSVTAFVNDDDISTLSVADATANEQESAKLFFTVSLSHRVQANGANADVSFKLNVGASAGDNAMANVDFTAVVAQDRKIDAGALTMTESVSLINDDVVELDETFTATISEARSARGNVKIGKASAKATIVDQEPNAKLTLTAEGTGIASEAVGAKLTFKASLSHKVEVYGSAGSQTGPAIQWSTQRASTFEAIAGKDFVAVTDKITQFSNSLVAGSGAEAMLVVDILNDDIQEAVAADGSSSNGEQFFVSIGKVVGGRVPSMPAGVMGKITDDEGGFIGFPYARGMLSSGHVEFKIWLSHAVETNLRVNYKTSMRPEGETGRAIECASALATGCDYVAQSNYIDIVAGQQGYVAQSVKVAVKPKQAGTISEIKRFNLELVAVRALTSDSGATGLAASWNIKGMTLGDKDTRVNNTWCPARASNGSCSPYPTFPSFGEWSIGEIYDDAGVAIVLSSPSGQETSGSFVFTIELTHAMPKPVSFKVATRNIPECLIKDANTPMPTATPDADYTPGTPTVITFKSKAEYAAEGSPVEGIKQYYTVAIKDDNINEPDEGFVMYIDLAGRSPTEYWERGLGASGFTNALPLLNIKQTALCDQNTATGYSALATITRTLEGTKLTFDDVTGSESAGKLTFTASLSTPISVPLVCDIVIEHGTTAAADFPAQAQVTLTGASQKHAFDVKIANDEIHETDESFQVHLMPTNKHPTDYGDIDMSAKGKGTITNDDMATLSVAAATAAEAADARLTFTVTLSHAVFTPVTVDYAASVTTSGAKYYATSSDFTAAASSLTFPVAAGKSTQTVAISIANDDIQEATESFLFSLSNILPSPVTFSENGKSAFGEITDKEAGVTLSIVDGTGAEEDGACKFTVTSSHAISDDVMFDTKTELNTARSTDVDASGVGTKKATAKFNGSKTATVAVPLLNDNTQEADKTFKLTTTVNADHQAVFNLPATELSASGTITDHENASVAFSAKSYSAAEGSKLVFALSLTHDSDSQTAIKYTLTGDNAVSGKDFEAVAGGDLVFTGAKSEQLKVEVTTLNDNVIEHQETITMVLSSSSNPKITADAKAVGTISDDENAKLTISPVNEANEAAGAEVVFEVTLSHGSQEDFAINYSTKAGTAKAGTDFVAAKSGAAVTFAKATTGTKNTVAIALVNDDIQEANDETFTLELALAGDEDRVLDKKAWSALATIKDMEGATVKVNSPSGTEASGSFVFTITVSHAFETDLVLTASTADVTAKGAATASENTKDFVTVNKAVTFTAGSAAGSSKTVEVTLIDDIVQELDETFNLVLEPNQAKNLDATKSNLVTTATITGDAEEGANLSIADGMATENDQQMSFAVKLSHRVSQGLKVAYRLGAAGDTADLVVGGSGDYSAKNVGDSSALEVSFAADLPGPQTQNLLVNIVNDAIEEASETFTVTLTSFTPAIAALKISRAVATGTIDEGSEASSEGVVVSSANVAGTEGNSMTFVVSLSKAFDVDFSVGWNVQFDGIGSKKASAADLSGATSGTITFAKNTLTREITLTVADDNIVEDTETFTLVLSAPSKESTPQLAGRFWTMAANPIGQITDTDTTEISIAGASGAEASLVLKFPVTFSRPVSVDVGFSYRTPKTIVTSLFTAVADENDFVIADGMFIMPAGTTSKTLDIVLKNDAVQEEDESFILQVRTETLVSSPALPVSQITFAPGKTEVTGTITDNENCRVMVADSRKQELANSAVSIQLVLTCQINAKITVDYKIHDASSVVAGQNVDWATVNVDYNLAANQPTSGSVEFPAFTESRSHDLNFIIRDDAIQEAAEEHVMVELSNGVVQGAATLKDKVTFVKYGSLIIQDVENTIITLTDASGPETSGTFSFDATVNNVFEPAVTMNVATVAGTASAGSDFEAKSTDIVFSGSSKKHTITVQVFDDNVVEADESFSVKFTPRVAKDAARFTITNGGVATGRLINDNEGGRLIVNGAEAAREGMGQLMLSVGLSHAVDIDVGVSYKTVAGTAVDGADYIGASGSVTFLAGDKSNKPLQTFAIKNDLIWEEPETFEVQWTLSTVQPRAIAYAPTRVSIVDDDNGELAVVVTSAKEGGIFIVNGKFTPTAQAPINMRWAVRHVETVAGDFAPSATMSGEFTLSAANGWTMPELLFPTQSDSLVEVDEIFFIDFKGRDAPVTFKITQGGELPGSRVTTRDGAVEVRIPNDDSASMTISQKDGSGVEGAPVVAVFTLTGRTEAAFDVAVSVSDGSALAGLDYTKPVAGANLVKFTGSAGESREFMIATIRDNLVERDETIKVTGALANPRLGAGLVLPSAVTMTITNADKALLTVTSDGCEEGQNLVFNIALSTAVDTDVEVVYVVEPFRTAGHGAAGSDDYRAVAANTAKFPASSAAPVRVSVATVQDDLIELDEDINLKVVKVSPSVPAYAVVFGADSACPDQASNYCGIGTIRNDDLATFTARSAGPVTEGGVLSFSLQMSLKADAAVVVTVGAASVDGGATCECRTAGAEDCFVDLNCGSIQISLDAGATTKTFTVQTTNDNIVEGEETVAIAFRGASADGRRFGTAVGGTIGTATITDDDSATVSIGAATGAEKTGKVEMAMVFSNRVDRPTTVQYKITAGPATTTTATTGDFATGVDATSLLTGTVAAYSLNGKMAVPVNVDGIAELDETFTVTVQSVFSAGRALTLGNAQAVGTIEDSDSRDFTVSLSGQTTVGETSGAATFNVNLSAFVANQIVVTVAAQSGTATANVDYTFAVTDKVFPAYNSASAVKTQTVSVMINADAVVEQTEQFTLRANVVDQTANPLSKRLAAAAGISQLTVSILDGASTPVVATKPEPAGVLEASEWKGKTFSVTRGQVKTMHLRVIQGTAQTCTSSNPKAGFLELCDPVTSTVTTVTVNGAAAGSTDVCTGAGGVLDGNTNCFVLKVVAPPSATAVGPQVVLVGGEPVVVQLQVGGGSDTNYRLSAEANGGLFRVQFEGTKMTITGVAAGTAAVTVTVCDSVSCGKMAPFDVTVISLV